MSRSATRCFYRSIPLCLALAFSASSLEAQGLAALAVPQSGEDPAASYHAKVRDILTEALQRWTESLERKDSVATASVYAPNARSLIGDAAEATSPLGVMKQLYKTPLAGAELTIQVDDFDMSGELAFVTCTLVAKTGRDSLPKLVRSMFVFRFDDGRNRWRVRQQFIDWRGAADPTSPAQ